MTTENSNKAEQATPPGVDVKPEVRGRRLRRFYLTAGCCFCDKLFTTFRYAWYHIQECHQTEINATNMCYPINYGCDPHLAHSRPVIVILRKSPRKKGISFKQIKAL